MPVYSVSTKIVSNVAPEKLLYDLSIYHHNAKAGYGQQKIHYLLASVSKQKLQSNYATQHHTTLATADPLTTIYIVEVMLYRQHPQSH